ncbi:hypothetical protein SPLC1_S080300 [Arthrospira platensis C1]|nr:hypothetical protein SPLC1_S080300 [Arthrospira platensis C1]
MQSITQSDQNLGLLVEDNILKTSHEESPSTHECP